MTTFTTVIQDVKNIWGGPGGENNILEYGKGIPKKTCFKSDVYVRNQTITMFTNSSISEKAEYFNGEKKKKSPNKQKGLVKNGNK